MLHVNTALSAAACQRKLTRSLHRRKQAKPKMSDEEWSAVEAAAVQRNDFQFGCPICLESFGSNPAVLLSCSHCFHAACLKSAEKLLGTKSCPMCRKRSYSSKETSATATVSRERAAVRLQTTIRALAARQSFLTRLREHYSRGLGDSRRRHHFLQNELISYTDRMQRKVDQDEDDLDKLFAECDNAVKTSALLISQATAAHHLFRQSNDDCDDVTPELDKPTEHEWNVLRERAVLRGETDCAICMGKLSRKKTVLLSCSHVFHRQCLRALEDFQKGDAQHQPACPCCRSPYHAREEEG